MAARPGCVIADYCITLGTGGTVVPMAGRPVHAVPTALPLFVLQSDGSYLLDEDPTISVLVGAEGQWSLTLPAQEDCDPTSVTWTITLPDGTVWSGPVTAAMVTASQGAPLGLHQLIVSYGWAHAATVVTTMDATTMTLGAVLVDAMAPGGGHPVAFSKAGNLGLEVLGDLLVGGTGGAPVRLPVGANGQVLTVLGGAPAWHDPSPATTTILGPVTLDRAPQGGNPIVVTTPSLGVATTGGVTGVATLDTGGHVPLGQLSADVPLLDATNTFTASQRITVNNPASGGNALVATNTSSSGQSAFGALNDLGHGVALAEYGSTVGAGLANLGVVGSDTGLALMTNYNTTTGTDPITFRVGGYDSSNERMRLTSTGNLLLGTTTSIASSGVGLAMQAAPGQLTALTQWRDSAGSVLASVSPVSDNGSPTLLATSNYPWPSACFMGGPVGIGTMTPNGSFGLVVPAGASLGVFGVGVGLSNGYIWHGGDNRRFFTVGGAVGQAVQIGSSDGIGFCLNGAGGGSLSTTCLTSTGALGLGTTTPGAQLTINNTAPDTLTPFVQDTFTLQPGHSAGEDVSSHTGELGATWTLQGGSNTIAVLGANGKVRLAGALGSAWWYAQYVVSGVPSGPDYTVQADILFPAVLANDCLVALHGRVLDANNFYRAGLTLNPDGSGVVDILRHATGGWVPALARASVTVSPGTTYTLALVMQGTSLSVQLDGVTVLGPVTDTNITAAGQAGFEFWVDTSAGFTPGEGVGPQLDNFSAIQVAPPPALTITRNGSTKTTLDAEGTLATLGTIAVRPPVPTAAPLLTVQSPAGQSSALTQWQDSTGGVLAKIDAYGDIFNSGSYCDITNTGPYLSLLPAHALLATRTATNVGLVVQGAAGQSSDLTQWQASDGTIRAGVGAGDHPVNPQTGAPFGRLYSTVPQSGYALGALAGPSGLNSGYGVQGGVWVGTGSGIELGTDSPHAMSLFTHATEHLTINPFGNIGLSSANSLTFPTANQDVTIVAGASTSVPLVLKGTSGQTANLLDLDLSTSSHSSPAQLGFTGANGTRTEAWRMFAPPYDTLQGGTDQHTQLVTYWPLILQGNAQNSAAVPYVNGVWAQSAANPPSVIIQTTHPQDVGLAIRGTAAQVGDLQQWQASDGTLLGRVFNSGSRGPTITSDNVQANSWGLQFTDGNDLEHFRIQTSPTKTIVYQPLDVYAPITIAQSTANPALVGVANYNADLISLTRGGGSGAMISVNQTAGQCTAFSATTTSGAYLQNNPNTIFYGNGTYQHTGAEGLGRGLDLTVTNNVGNTGVLYGALINATANTAGATALGLAVSAASSAGASTVAQFVCGSPTTVGTVVQASAGQTGDLQRWEDGAGGVLAKVDAGGNLTCGTIATGSSSISTQNITASFIGCGELYVTSSSNAVALGVIGHSGQTADLQQWSDSTSAVLAKVDASGNLSAQGLAISPTTTTTAPAAGAAGALPATPAGYATVTIGGVQRVIAYY